MKKTIIIEERFCGPPGMANGGYVSGILAQAFDGPAEVTLRRPVPVERPLHLARLPDGRVVLQDGDDLLAEARTASLDLETPAPPTYAEAEAASARYPEPEEHPLPNCFVCGPAREAGNGLQIFAAPVADRQLVAAPWTPPASLADASGTVAPHFLWAALDCPGAFAADSDQGQALLLGRLTAAVERSVHPGEQCVVAGWLLERSGRKYFTGTALFAPSGAVIARAKAVWFAPKSD